MAKKEQNMILVFTICVILTVVTATVAGVTIAKRQADQKSRTEASQRDSVSSALSVLELLVNESLTRLRVATAGDREWFFLYESERPNTLLTNRSTFVSDWNASVFNLWAPRVNSTPDELLGFEFNAKYLDPDNSTVTLAATDYIDVSWNGDVVQVHGSSEALDTTLYVHEVTRVGDVVQCNPAVLYTAPNIIPWLGIPEYFDKVNTWTAADGSAYLYLVHTTEFLMNTVTVSVQAFINPNWVTKMVNALGARQTGCVIFDDSQMIIGSNIKEYNDDFRTCQMAHAPLGDAVTACVQLAASQHRVAVIRDIFRAAYPNNSSAARVDEMKYVDIGGRKMLLAAKTVVAQNRLKLDAVCIEEDTSSVNTGSSDIVLALLPVMGSVLILAVLVLAQLASMRGRGTWNAPKDMTKPMAMMFTDVQSSTSLWARDAEAMSTAIDIHHATIRAMLQKHRGYEVKTIGDAFMVAFKDPKDAVRCALEIQTALFAQEWPVAIDEGYEELLGSKQNVAMWHGLRVRVGLHYGSANIAYDEIVKSYDYYGTLVNTAARVEAIGHGGQVIVTGAVFEAIGNIDGCVCMSVGREILRGLSEPVDLIQLLPQVFEFRQFPPLRLDHADAREDVDAVSSHVTTVTDTKSSAASSYAESVNVEEMVRQAAVKVAPSLPGMPLENIELGVGAQYQALRAVFTVGSKEFKKTQLLALADKWGVPGSQSNFSYELTLVRIAAKAFSALELHSDRRGSANGARKTRFMSAISITPSLSVSCNPPAGITLTLPGAVSVTDSAGFLVPPKLRD